MRVRAILLAAALALAPLGARAADLVVWWDEGFHSEEDQAVREIVAAFEHETGRRVELVLPSQDELTTKTLDALGAGHPPDLLYGALVSYYYPRWAQEGRLVDLTDALGPFTTQFDRDALAAATLFDATIGRRGLYLLPLGLNSHHVHVWRSLLEQAGLRLEDIPKQWEPFWSFWCDKVQPAVREATGRDDVYGTGLAMSVEASDTDIGFRQ